MKTNIYQLLKALAIYYVLKSLVAWLTQHGLTVENWKVLAVFVMPVIEEVLKRLLNRKGAYIFGIVESVYGYPEQIAFRLITTDLMHAGTRKHGLGMAVLLHIVWNIFVRWSLDYATLDMYIFFVAVGIVINLMPRLTLTRVK